MSVDDQRKYTAVYVKDTMTDDKPIGYWFVTEDFALHYKDKKGSWIHLKSAKAEKVARITAARITPAGRDVAHRYFLRSRYRSADIA